MGIIARLLELAPKGRVEGIDYSPVSVKKSTAVNAKAIAAGRCQVQEGFAAGAMMYVVVEELIPETAQGRHTNLSTLGFALGFVLMMVMDVLLG